MPISASHSDIVAARLRPLPHFFVATAAAFVHFSEFKRNARELEVVCYCGG